MSAWCEQSQERRESPEWEPEPLYLPIEAPRQPEPADDPPAEVESRVIVIDLV